MEAGDLAEVQPGATRSRISRTVRTYIALTKPHIIWLLLITTVPAMVLAEQGWPSTWLVIATLIGGMLAAGSANAINQYADRDIDVRMRRTSRRPLPVGAVSPGHAAVFGLALGFVSVVWMVATVNVIAALLSLGAIAFYVVIYTYLLKRNTSQNIVIGGAAGAAPALIGWAAVTGDLASLEPIFMFLIVFWWTPPHFWALALVLEDDYRAAGVPMLPVVRGVEETKRQILLWSVMLVALTVLFAGVAELHAVYWVVSVAAGAVFIGLAAMLWREPGITKAWPLFKYSTYYLAALFAAILVDQLLNA
ncbi:MAG: heme o synthase [Dehalococcoidia bacterium]|nr:heme o synthase [Dehalococcoidia bacterium]